MVHVHFVPTVLQELRDHRSVRADELGDVRVGRGLAHPDASRGLLHSQLNLVRMLEQLRKQRIASMDRVTLLLRGS